MCIRLIPLCIYLESSCIVEKRVRAPKLANIMGTKHNKFPASRPNAKKMYEQVMSATTPVGVIPLLTAAWKRTKSKRQHSFGHSYTCPTPKEYFQQRMGLAIANAAALHIRDIKLGNLTAPENENDEEFDDPNAIPAESTDPIGDNDDDLLTSDPNDLPFDIFTEPMDALTAPDPAATSRLLLYSTTCERRRLPFVVPPSPPSPAPHHTATAPTRTPPLRPPPGMGSNPLNLPPPLRFLNRTHISWPEYSLSVD